MNIFNFRMNFDNAIISRGYNYYYTGRILNLFYNPKEDLYLVKVKGSGNKIYDVYTKIDKKGEISSLGCNCPYSDSGNLCKHSFAALLFLYNECLDQILKKSSPEISSIISSYSNYLINNNEKETASLIPDLHFDDIDGLILKMKIGNEKKYVVGDFSNLINDFREGNVRNYGKNYRFVHDYNSIDGKSRKYLDFVSGLYYEQKERSFNAKKRLILKGDSLGKFLDVLGDDPLVINSEHYEIKHCNPKIVIKLDGSGDDYFSISIQSEVTPLGRAGCGYFIDANKHIFYISEPKFTNAVFPLVEAMRDKIMFISKEDISSFYNTVIRNIEIYVTVEVTDVPEEIIPPQMVPCLYIDVNSSDEICSILKYKYDNEEFLFDYEKEENRFCDNIGEQIALQDVKKYFPTFIEESDYPFVIESEEGMFDFITEGMSVLSKTMDLFLSESFKRINVRKAVRPSVGIRASEGLLEINFGADGYSKEELLELLNSYRVGKKFHRFKDGSFSMINDSVEELGRITKELNINDKAFLKSNIKVPMYRMIYLNSLQSDLEAVRVSRSREFKKMIESYENSLDSDECVVPASLDGIMRDYQKIGFEWFSTLSKYHLGGILADDMGLGKTIQAIALMLSIKENSQEHVQFMVVSPSSLTINWQNEINKFAPSLKSVCMTGTAAERKKQFDEIDQYDVVITSYSTLLRDIEKYENKIFMIQFIDEAQNIKNHNTQSAKAVKAIKSNLRFALTGTPIENTLAELWSIFDFVMPGYLYNYTYFKKNYEVPIVKKNDPNALKSMRRLISPFILRRLKKEVLTELPEKSETVLYTEMEGEQQKIYIANASQVKGELANMDSSDKLKILALLTRLRQLCCDPALVYENYDGGSSKLEQCIELILSCVEAGHKILLFSQFTTMLDRIAERLQKDNVSYYMLTGKTKSKDRLKLVDDFNSNNVSVFLISLKAGGTGLNLTGADIVIHYDPWWNLSAENQASDRAYRIGQKNNVQIYKLIVKNTIEEKIRNLQLKKTELIDATVSGEGDIMNMSTKDIIELLE